MNPLSLFAAVFWGSIGLGFFIYGKKKKRPAPLVGGALIMALSYFARTPLSLSLAAIAVIVCIYLVSKRM